MAKSVLGTKYVIVDNLNCFVKYVDAVDELGYAYIESTTSFPPVRHRYDNVKDAEEHILYLESLLKVEIGVRTEAFTNDPEYSSPKWVLDELNARTFRVATITVT